jgi:hypothetical protein
MREAVFAGPSFIPLKNCIRCETRGSTPGILESTSWMKEVMVEVTGEQAQPTVVFIYAHADRSSRSDVRLSYLRDEWSSEGGSSKGQTA